MILSGAARFKKAGGDLNVESGSICVVNALESFNEIFEGDTNILVMKFPLQQCPFLMNLLHHTRYLTATPSEADFGVMRDISLLALEQTPSTSVALRNHLSQTIMNMLRDVITQESNLLSGRDRITAFTLQRVKEYITHHLSDDRMDVQVISDAVSLSVNYLNRLFKRDGTTLMRYVWQQRIEAADKLLTHVQFSNLSLAEIAWQCGFVSQSHFCHLYKKKFGVSPGQNRKPAA
jgi:transcriptional regulator GlxA family with amidase domain